MFLQKIEFNINPATYIATFIVVGLLIIFFIVREILQHRKIKKIINSSKKQAEEKGNSGPKAVEPFKKYSTNKISLKEHKSGLSWGGGNIKGAGASRGTKRQFLKKD